MTVHVYWDAGNQVYWETHRERIVKVIGPGVEASVNLANDIATEDPVGWVTTVVEGGSVSTELSGSPTQGFIARVATDDLDNDGGNYQAPGQTFRCVSGMKWYAGLSFTADEATQSDLLFGVCVTDTTLLGSVADGVYMESLDAGTGISVVAEKNGSETQTDSLGTMSTSAQIWEMFWDGTNITYYIDGVVVKSISSGNIPDDEPLRVSLAFLTGEASIHTLDIAFLRGFAWA